MTRKDYELIARTLRKGLAGHAMIQLFAQALKETNPAFDKVKFYKASKQEADT